MYKKEVIILIESDVPIKNKIREFRLKNKITQAELAKELGISRPYLTHVENLKFSPGPDVMKKACEYFNVSLEQLFYL